MDHGRALSLIDRYLKKNLHGKELREFLDHMESCSACYDELEVRSLVLDVDEALRDGEENDFDFSGRLPARIAKDRRRILLDKLLVVLVGIGGFILVGLIIYGFFFR